MTTTFVLNTRSEFLKLRHTSAFWLTLLAAGFIPAINGIICIEKATDMIPKFRDTPWITFLRYNWKNTAAVILPFYVILLINLVPQLEYRNMTWKQVYASPRKYADIFFSKFVIIQILIICFFILFNLFMIASAYTINVFQNGYSFSHTAIPWYMVLQLSIRIYTGILGVTAIQYWMSTRFKNFVLPLGAGLGLWIAGLVLMEWDHIIYYPYMYSTLLFFTDFTRHPDYLPKLIINSLTCFVLALLLGFWNIYQQKERG